MRTIPGALATHMAQGSTTLAYLLKITRLDGAVFAFTSSASDVISASVTYLASPGLDASGLVTSAGLSVDNLELTTLDDGTTFTRDDVLTGKWRNAAFTISRCNFRAPADGVDVLMVGTLGNVALRDGHVVAELRALQQILQQPIGSVSSKTCRARLGDTLCAVNLASWTYSATVTSLSSNQVFTASSLAQAADYFGEGILTWTSGPSAGLVYKVKLHAAGGVLTLMLPPLLTVAVGQTFNIVAGCRKRLEDCRAKFNNVLNMQAEPHLPGVDALSSPPT